MAGSNTPMRVAVRIPPCRPLPEIARVVRQAEEAGFDTATIPDSPTIWRNTMAALCVAAIETERITLAVSVTNFVTRPPVILASETRTVAELAPGRFRLGIGAGDSAVNLSGNRSSKTREIREGVRVVSELLAGRPAHPDTPDLVLHDPCGPVPIFIGATGPLNLALAAEIADGVQLQYRGMQEKFRHIDAVLAKVNRTRPLHRMVSVNTRITDDVEREAQRMKPSIANYARRDGAGVLRAAGFNVSVPSGHIPLPDGTDLGHPRNLDMAIEVASQWISDELAMWFVQNLCFFGTGKEIAERFIALSAQGVDEVLCTANSAFTMPTDLITKMGEDVIPHLHAATR